jgi:hypothetical protein
MWRRSKPDVAQRGVHPVEGRFTRRGGTTARLDGLMAAPGLGHGGEALKAIADHGAACRQAPFGKNRHRSAGKAADPAQLDADRFAVLRRVDRGDEGSLARGSPIAPAGAFSPKISIVDLDAAGQLPVGIRPA